MRAFDLAASVPWAIQPDALRAMLALANREDITPETVAAAMAGSPAAVAARLGRPLDNAHRTTVRDGVAVIPISGPIFRYANLFSEVSGATSTDAVSRDLTAALEDPSVMAILLEIDSPGGEVAGTAELAAMIHAATEHKPVWAYVDSLGASAAYWLAAAADRIVVASTAIVGSIGVVSALRDPTKSKSTDIEFVSSQSPKKRADITTEAGRAQVQTVVDALADVFVSDVAHYRGVTPETVLADFGQGDVFVGEAAMRAGLVDAVGSFEGALSDIAAEAGKRGGLAARSRRFAVAASNGVIDRIKAVLAEFDGSADQEAKIVSENLPTTETKPAAAPSSTAVQPEHLADLQARNATLEAELAATKAVAEANAEQSRQLAERVKAMELDARRKRFTAEVLGKSDASSIRWFGETERHVAMLEHLADSAGEDSPLFTGYVTQQRALAEQMRSSNLFTEIGGGSGDGTGAATAWDRVQAAAQALMAADSTLTEPVAVDRVLATDRKLAAEYLAEQRAGASRR